MTHDIICFLDITDDYWPGGHDPAAVEGDGLPGRGGQHQFGPPGCHLLPEPDSAAIIQGSILHSLSSVPLLGPLGPGAAHPVEEDDHPAAAAGGHGRPRLTGTGDLDCHHNSGNSIFFVEATLLHSHIRCKIL